MWGLRYGADSSNNSDLKDSASTQGHIFAVYIHPEYIGLGYGSKCLQEATECWQAGGTRDVARRVFEQNVCANAFYKRYNFQITGRIRTDDRWAIPDQELVLRM